MKLLYCTIFLLVLISLGGCSEKPEELVLFQEGAVAPKLDLKILQGPQVTFGNNVSIIEFWATWCAPCKESAPMLSGLQQKYRDQGLTVIGISSEDETVVKPYMADNGQSMAYTVALDPEGKTQKRYVEGYGKEGVPWAFLIDATGKIAWVGHPMAPELEENLRMLLDSTDG